MTVKELISKLEELPQNSTVYDEYGQDISDVTFTADHVDNVTVNSWVTLEFGYLRSDIFEEF